MATIYIHTLNDQPAAFDPVGGRICFASQYGPPNKAATSLKQIRREQAMSIENDRARCVVPNDEFVYGYKRFRV